MKILAVADMPARRFYDFYRPGCLDEYDLIIACGDLDAGYLDFLSSMAQVPVLYVRGNHDEALLKDPPGGLECIEDRVFVYNGVRFLGLGGSIRYKRSPCMFTERQMRRRILRVLPSVLFHRGFDVLVTHSPARHLNDFDNYTHRGFECFNRLLQRYQPAVFVHGHIHTNYGMHIPRYTRHGSTLVVNACEYAVIELKQDMPCSWKAEDARL